MADRFNKTKELIDSCKVVEEYAAIIYMDSKEEALELSAYFPSEEYLYAVVGGGCSIQER